MSKLHGKAKQRARRRAAAQRTQRQAARQQPPDMGALATGITADLVLREQARAAGAGGGGHA
jgi:hypothetical protein